MSQGAELTAHILFYFWPLLYLLSLLSIPSTYPIFLSPHPEHGVEPKNDTPWVVDPQINGHNHCHQIKTIMVKCSLCCKPIFCENLNIAPIYRLAFVDIGLIAPVV